MLNFSTKTTQHIAAASLLVVFITDIFMPARFGVDILYLCSILLVFKQDAKTIIGFAVVACLLIFIDEDFLFFEHKATLNAVDFINRVISVFAISITSYIAVHYGELRKTTMQKEKEYLYDLKEMLFITSHQVRKPLANILGLIEIMNMDTTSFSVDSWRTRLNHLHASANELDSFLRQLNEFIEKTDYYQSQTKVRV